MARSTFGATRVRRPGCVRGDVAVGRMARSCGKVAIVWGSEPPAFSIGWERPLGSWDSGFSVLFEDAPDPEDVPEDNPTDHPRISLVCLHCLLDEHPEVGRGLDVARERGAADLDERGVWVGRTVDDVDVG